MLARRLKPPWATRYEPWSVALVSRNAKLSQVDSSAFIFALSFSTTCFLAGDPKSANYKEEADDTAKVAYIKEAVKPGSAALFEANKLSSGLGRNSGVVRRQIDFRNNELP